MTVSILDATAENILKAAAQLKAGGLVAFPTETVYGLGADASNDKAVAAIFEAKGRPSFNPLIVHVNSLEEAAQYVDLNAKAKLLASLYWPGALTFILPRKTGAKISLLAGAGLPTLAIRSPSHSVARQLIKAAGVPVAAPSANASGGLSPTTPQHVAESLGEKAGMILAGGKSQVGLESTVIDLSGETPVLLRPGGVTLEELEMQIGKIDVQTEAVDDNPKSPGQLLKHYAPKTPLRLKAVDVMPGEGLLAFGSTKFMGIRGGGGAVKDFLNLSEQGDLTEAAANLFSMLHQLDSQGFKSIAVMSVPETGLGRAINDRLRRAAGSRR